MKHNFRRTIRCTVLLMTAVLAVLAARPDAAAAAGSAGGVQNNAGSTGKLSGIKEIVASSGFWGGSSFALRQDGSVWVWGSNVFGQFAKGTASPEGWTVTPQRIATLDGTRQLVIGYGFYAALSRDGTVKAWGGRLLEQSGTAEGGTRVSTPQPIAGMNGIVKLAARDGGLLALRSDGKLMNWEVPAADGSYVAGVPAASEVPGITDVKDIASGGAFHAALRSNGTLWLWADEDQGAGRLLRTKPAQIPNLYYVKSFVLDGRSLVALTESGSVWATTGIDYEHFLPQAVKKMSKLSGIVSIETKESLNLARSAKGDTWVWESETDQRSLQKITAVPQMARVSLIPDGMIIVQKNGTSWNVGREWAGEKLTFKRPWQIKGLLNPVSFASGENSKYAVLKDGTAVAWGTNMFGQLGINTPESRPFTASPIMKPVSLKVDGRSVESEQSSILLEGRVMVPVRAFAESLGYTVSWDNGIKLERNGRTVRIEGGQLSVDGKTVPLTPAPLKVSYTQLVPAGPLAAALGAAAKWDSANYELTISPMTAGQ
ncbi:stalk domain-containing protein [Paenibacillus tengchongensis]|uniref:stalk domain-containing protein n=1 Tax=Paenibacillus tengchongensis TaxID=2608684 RepID=UPI00124F4D01|nr:stalk domain-containing protein [Paenibacillus tengchongensis]